MDNYMHFLEKNFNFINFRDTKTKFLEKFESFNNNVDLFCDNFYAYTPF